MNANTISLESILSNFRAGHSLERSQIERLATNGVNLGMTAEELRKVSRLLRQTVLLHQV